MRHIRSVGRPTVTHPGVIERAAFALFAEHGFAATTLDDIARAVGVSQRTVTRYYPSKNDIPWGQFDATLGAFAETLGRTPSADPLWKRIHTGIVIFNDYPVDAFPSHRFRMWLILNTPALEAHSAIRYQQWRAVVASFAAAELSLTRNASVPNLIGHVSLALALEAYERWLNEPPAADERGDKAALLRHLTDTVEDLRAYLA